jgi:valyl-tRNA synthetase
MPFITEEIWQSLRERKDGESIMVAATPQALGFRQELIDRFSVEEEVIMAIRTFRKEKNIPFKDPIKLYIKKNNDENPDVTFDPVVLKLCNLDELNYTEEKVPDCSSFIVKRTEFYIPVPREIDPEAEMIKLMEELTYVKGFLESVLKKLGNEKFIKNAAPQVVEAERKKKSDAEARINVLEEQIRELKS